MPVENPDFKAVVQSLTYRTMAAEREAWVSGDAVVGSIKRQFGVSPSRYQPSEAGQVVGSAREDIASFLGDLRAERADDPVERPKDLKTVFIKEQVLEPITS